MEGELKKVILVWSTVVASLCYCHRAGKLFPSGTARHFAIFPVVLLFLLLPLNLTSIHFGGTTSFFIAWLASFKLILFAFNQGPLSSDPSIPLSRFILLACFPIKFHQSHPKTHKSPLIYFAKILIFAFILRIYDYKQHLHPKIILFCYCLHVYFMLEMLLALVAALTKALVHVELEQHFNEPYLATSLQDFWGRRWNLMVPNILQPTVYHPVTSIAARFMDRKWAAIPGVLATFLVSGLMHELVLYNIGRLRPSGEMMCFFMVHGLSLTLEIVIKKILRGKFSLPGIVSGPLTLAYIMYTSFLLFFPPFLRSKADVKGCTESLAFIEFIKNHRLVGPNDISCPFH
ncbi:putative long-chain-alcohol O-fatty-acyltransferase 4 [Sesamum angolense]|uniref:Long-chain-alcohol O-fatty-acyltransferase 4 n=1 Tax=Sesamum angolense TaxID=2727404 RepID=A0AAE2BV73_9LAMI|nr:putative long-chain-alcohol O-fatty-acyltransferase 4 [Sesamum angolense]